MDIGEALGMTLRYDTREDLRIMGVGDWDDLCALPDRTRLLLFGWGSTTERRFQQRKAQLAGDA